MASRNAKGHTVYHGPQHGDECLREFKLKEPMTALDLFYRTEQKFEECLQHFKKPNT
jgi:hypothetical protein